MSICLNDDVRQMSAVASYRSIPSVQPFALPMSRHEIEQQRPNASLWNRFSHALFRGLNRLLSGALGKYG